MIRTLTVSRVTFWETTTVAETAALIYRITKTIPKATVWVCLMAMTAGIQKTKTTAGQKMQTPALAR